MTNPITTSQWQENLVQSEIVTPGPMGVGTQVREVRRIGSSQSEAFWEVTEYTPPTKRAYWYPNGFGPFQQKGITTFAAIPEGTLLHFTALVETRFPLNLLLPVLKVVMRWQNQKSFAALKRVLEMSVSPALETVRESAKNPSEGIEKQHDL